MTSPCGQCGKPVIYDFPRNERGEIIINRLEPISKYWKSDHGRLGPIIEPYCNAQCGLDKYEEEKQHEIS